MRVLAIGGSGYVGQLTLPLLPERFAIRIFDLQPPASHTGEYVEGDVLDIPAVRNAAEGCNALLYMAMGHRDHSSPEGILAAFRSSVTGVYTALYAAHQAGIAHAVYTSSMSVYADLEGRHFQDEEIVPDCRHIYGFTKRLGEEVCRNAAQEWGMSVNALRLCHPQADSEWYSRARVGVPTIATAATDVARSLEAALDYREGGFHAFMISGDYAQRTMNMSKASHLLGWAPLARPQETP